MELTKINYGKVAVGSVVGATAAISVNHFKQVALNSIRNERDRKLVDIGVSLAQLGVGGAAFWYGFKYSTDLFWKPVNVVFGIASIIQALYSLGKYVKLPQTSK